MKIHAIETGRVKITQNWRVGRGGGLRRLVNTLFDNRFSDWLPIYAWLIEHPEGLILIDTGIPTDANKPIWFPPFMRLVQRAAKFDMTAEQEIGPQLKQLGFSPDDVRWVVLTHLHQDHDGGLRYFRNAEFVVSREEWAVAAGIKGRLGGYLNHRWPDWFKPRLIDFGKTPLGPFPGHAKLTEAGDVYLVPTPGHSRGHMSLILVEEGRSIFFAGDASYTEALLIAQQADGIGDNPQVQAKTHQQILAYAEQHPTVYLPSHDPDAKHRLDNRMTIEGRLGQPAWDHLVR